MDINTLNMKEVPLLLRNGQFDRVILYNKLVFLPFLLFLFGDSAWSIMGRLEGGGDPDMYVILSNVCMCSYIDMYFHI